MYMARDEGDGGGTGGYGSSYSSQLTPPSSPNDGSPSIPLTSEPSSQGATPTETVAQAYLAALAAQGKNTTGDTSPYVVIPNQADTGGGKSISIVMVLVVVALGFGAWWLIRRKVA